MNSMIGKAAFICTALTLLLVISTANADNNSNQKEIPPIQKINDSDTLGSSPQSPKNTNLKSTFRLPIICKINDELPGCSIIKGTIKE